MDDRGFSMDDLGSAIMMGNSIALQWYAATHQQAIPGTPGSVVLNTPQGGYSASFGSGSLLMLGLIVVAAVILLK